MFRNNKNRISIKKNSLSKLFLPFLFSLIFILVLFNKTDYFFINTVKNLGIDYVAPVTRLIASPVTLISNAIIRYDGIVNLQNENLKLKEEVFRLKKWQTLAIKNYRENRVFKRLLKSTSHSVDVIKTASVINQSPGIYSKLITLNAGLNFNIFKDYAVINEKGLVGKTIFSSKENSKVLLINDQSSSIPVKTLSDSSFSILSGTTDGKYLIGLFSKNNKLPLKGELLVTSGNAKIFPRDILVAKVILVKEDHYIALPFVDFNNLNYVQIVKSK